MSFRRRWSEWDEFVKQEADALRRCGIPSELFESKQRFHHFIDHGYDGLEAEAFTVNLLTDVQLADFAAFVDRSRYFGDYSRRQVALWIKQRQRRSGLARPEDEED